MDTILSAAIQLNALTSAWMKKISQHSAESQQRAWCPDVIMGGGLLHVDMFAHNKSGIAYQNKNRRPETVVNYKGNPTSSRGCHQTVPNKHLVQGKPDL
jgi:hypothetical protein